MSFNYVRPDLAAILLRSTLISVLKRRVAHPGIADDSSGRGTPQLEMQPQQPGSIAHLTENLALSIKNTTDRSIDYRSIPRKMTSHPNAIKATPRANQCVP
jgi:hypothetical protein